ncbi:TMV resistance protein N [Trifolium repens]|nr:TMV resistance protein N [Trifolium repens]
MLEISIRDGLLSLIRKSLCHLNICNMRVETLDQGKETTQNLLFNKKVLLVLDDLSSDIQLENLAGKQEWFGLRRKVMITTRDKCNSPATSHTDAEAPLLVTSLITTPLVVFLPP